MGNKIKFLKLQKQITCFMLHITSLAGYLVKKEKCKTSYPSVIPAKAGI